MGTALLATLCSTAAGITAVKLLERLRCFRLPVPVVEARTDAADAGPEPREPAPAVAPMPDWGWPVLAGFLGLFVWLLGHLLQQPPASPEGGGAFIRVMNAVSLLAIPFFLAGFPLYAALRRVPVYEEFVEGAKEGFHVAVRIIPFLVAMLLAVGMFRAAGGIELLARGLRPMLDLVGFPTELLPMTLMRPLSGSATIGLFTELVNTHGPDSLVSRMAATVLGSTETTLYVVAVYFGAVSIRRTRHAVAAGLLADLAGVIASVAICWVVFGRGG